jgi:hypothetical protein
LRSFYSRGSLLPCSRMLCWNTTFDSLLNFSLPNPPTISCFSSAPPDFNLEGLPLLLLLTVGHHYSSRKCVASGTFGRYTSIDAIALNAHIIPHKISNPNSKMTHIQTSLGASQPHTCTPHTLNIEALHNHRIEKETVAKLGKSRPWPLCILGREGDMIPKRRQ